MKDRVFLLLLLTLGAVSLPAAEPDTVFNADIQLLTRGELRNGGITSNNPDNSLEDQSAFILDRERITLDYRRDWLEAKAAIQHVGTWGHEGGATVSIYEAWGRLNAKNGLFGQIGRLALRYDDERIIGADDWVMAPMTHDALLMGYEGHGHKVHTLLAYNQNFRAVEEPGSYYSNGSSPYKTMQTVWYHYDLPRVPLGISLLMMNIGMQAGEKDGKNQNSPHTEWQHVYGAYAKFAPKHFSIEGSYYRQGGRDEKSAKMDAWMAAVKAKWQPNPTWSLLAGYDYLSGDDYVTVLKPGSIGMPRHEVNKGFNPVYGSHHKFYGAMDFFYLSAYVNGFTPGLQNAYFGGTFQPLKKLSIKVLYHYLAVGTELANLNKTLGHEIELETSFELTKDICLSAGFSYMTGTETMERLKRASGDGNLRWSWCSLIISPQLFSVKTH